MLQYIQYYFCSLMNIIKEYFSSKQEISNDDIYYNKEYLMLLTKYKKLLEHVENLKRENNAMRNKLKVPENRIVMVDSHWKNYNDRLTEEYYRGYFDGHKLGCQNYYNNYT